MLQFARRSPLLCTTSAFTLSSQPSLRLSVSVKALPANSHFSGSSQFSKVTYQQLLSVYQFLKIIFLHDCTYLEGTPFYFILIGNTSRPVLPFEMWNANFPLPTGRICVHVEPWQAMLQNTPLEDILTSPATGYMNTVCMLEHLFETLELPF